MTTKSADTFAQLLTQAVRAVSLRHSRRIQDVQHDIAKKLGRKGGTALEHWRKGHFPRRIRDVEQLTRELVSLQGLGNRQDTEAFLIAAGYPNPLMLGDELFPNQAGISSTEFARFIAGPPIQHPRHFFGRTREIKLIFGLWRRFPLQNVALIGPHRSGKSSILHYLSKVTTVPTKELRPNQYQGWLSRPEIYRWIFVDFQDARMCRRDRLLSYLLQKMEIDGAHDSGDLYDFMDLVSENLTRPTIIMMDEIGAALEAPELDFEFWQSLRSLGTNQTEGHLGFILTSKERPSDIAQQVGKTSPFFNIFGHTINLGPFSEAGARELIASSPKPFEPADIDWILEQSRLWPNLLQLLCHTRLVALEEGQLDDQWRDDGLAQLEPFRHLLSS